MKSDTLLQHLGEETHDRGAVTPPIYQTSLFVFDTVEDMKSYRPYHPEEERFVYSRVGNPTNAIVEKKVAALEKTDGARLFSSGMGAISAAVMTCLKAGDHVVCIDTVYGPTRALFERYLKRFGVDTTFVVGEDPEDFKAAMKENTALMYLESPSSMLFKLQDIRAITSMCKERGIKTVIDNSFATPIFQQPATMGVDLVCHTATKYLGGHSDLVAGVTCGPAEVMERMGLDEMELLGGTLPPFPAWLVLRGMRTLGLRVKHANEVGHKISKFLKGHPAVEEVYFAGSDWHRQKDLYDKQMTGSASLMTFQPRVQDQASLYAFANELENFQIGVSWGGYESLVTVNQLKPHDWPEAKWTVRIYCGLEDPGDLLDDLDRNLRKHLM